MFTIEYSTKLAIRYIGMGKIPSALALPCLPQRRCCVAYRSIDRSLSVGQNQHFSKPNEHHFVTSTTSPSSSVTMTMMTMKSSIALLLASLAAITTTTTTSALDVEITDVHCNANYAITASMFMTCYNGDGEDGSEEESSRCTFGTEATLTGQIYFAGLEYTNVVNNNNIAGLYGTLYAPTGTAIYDFANAYEISLCDETLFTPIEDDLVCPADGTYLWNSPFVLPNSEYLDDFWASGWEPYATLQFEDGAGNLIGDCKITMMTYASATNGSNESSNNPLSQMATGKSAVIAMLVLIGVFLLLVIYCCFCCQKKKTAAADENKETEFTRMDDKPAVNREQPAPTPVGGPAWTAV